MLDSSRQSSCRAALLAIGATLLAWGGPICSAAAPSVLSVRRGWDPVIAEPYLDIRVTPDTEAIGDGVSHGFSTSYTSGFWHCAPEGAATRCRYYLGAYYCKAGTATACSWWQDDAHHIAPMPVLPRVNYSKIVAAKPDPARPVNSNATLVSAPVGEARVWCTTATGATLPRGCPCRMFPNVATTVQAGETCTYP